MKTLSSLLCVLVATALNAVTFTEFYVQTTGDNLNAGSTADNAAIFTATGGNWTNSTATFYKSGIDLSGVTTNMWASVYADGATATGFIGQITAVDDTADTITVSTTAISGTNPTDGVGDRSIKVGGAWDGPSGAVDFPFDFIGSAATNRSGNVPRVNIKSGVDYSVSATITQTANGPLWFQGYTTSPGDGGIATIDGGATGVGFKLFQADGNNVVYSHLALDHNGDSGTGAGWSIGGTEVVLIKCVASNLRSSGFTTYGGYTQLISCEAYGNNINDSANLGGFVETGSYCLFLFCYSHDNNKLGYYTSGSGNVFVGCVADSNTLHGFQDASVVASTYLHCDSYNNTQCGLDMSGASIANRAVVSCNFVKNGTYGIASSGSALRIGVLASCGFGSGTQTNSSGNIADSISSSVRAGMLESGTVTYPSDSTPWSDPANGDFRISLAQAKGVGYGDFVTNSTSVAWSVQDIGAVQSGGASSESSLTWSH